MSAAEPGPGFAAGRGGPALVADLAPLDAVLREHAAALGGDFTGYRNHAYRVANLCLALAPDVPERVEKVALAAAFHDLGIWTDGTFDYLAPSIRLARAHLARAGRPAWTGEIEAMIADHHKLSRARAAPHPLVEPFRRADWIDVTRGLRAFGLPRRFLREVFAAWPNAGFHRRLLQLSLHRLRTHPLNPLPMFRL